MKQSEHGRILGSAAKQYLVPLGGRRKGRSRVWNIDHGYWLVHVEFQPSSWSRGSYLNVSTHWLWQYEAGPISFDYHPSGSRVKGLVPFHSCEQFEPEACRLAARAAEEARKLRAIFNSIAETARILTDLVGSGGRGMIVYHAAVASGLVGEVAQARDLFRLFQVGFPHPAYTVAAHLDRLLDEPDAYRAAIQTSISEQRARNRLPVCVDPFGSIV